MKGFLSLCYHYIRPDSEKNTFPRLLGNTETEFKQHLDMLANEFEFVSLDGIESERDRTGMLITFDDGLADHYRAAQILHERGIKAVFFIPTCILDNEPANPIIIHYGLYLEKIEGFLNIYNQVIFDSGLLNHNIEFVDKNRPWETIKAIKNKFKYELSQSQARKLLLKIYQKLKEKYPGIFTQMHLSKQQLKQMVEMGHDLGTHTHTHISVAWQDLSANLVNNELIKPKQILESTFKTEVKALSYPFGEEQDCLATAKLLNKTDHYNYAFTIKPHLNLENTSKFELGRYTPRNTDDMLKLKRKLLQMAHS